MLTMDMYSVELFEQVGLGSLRRTKWDGICLDEMEMGIEQFFIDCE